MWVSWKQPTWQREYQVTRPCDKKGPGVFKDQQSFQGPEVTASGVQWVRKNSRQYQRRNRQDCTVSH